MNFITEHYSSSISKSLRIFYLISVLVVCTIILPAQDYDKMYYSSDWIGTSYDNATYYRVSGFNDTLLVFDGQVVDKYNINSQIEMTGNYINGLKNGEFKYYFPDGRVKLIANYIDNARIGIWKQYYNNGKLKVELKYEGDNELIMEINDSTGNSLIKDNKFIMTQPGYIFKGQIVDKKRHGKWIIKSDEFGESKMIYAKGKLKKGFLDKNDINSKITFQRAFPLIIETNKFYNTENFLLEHGALIKNNYVLEGLHRNKYLTASERIINSNDEFESFIHKEFDLTNSTTESIIQIFVTIEDSKPIECSTIPKISERAFQDLNLIVSTIDRFSFITNGVLKMDYKIIKETRLKLE